ncbi:MAG TPA: Fic family protein [Coriobacteriia bacterium]
MYRYRITAEIQKDLDRIEMLRERFDNRGALPRRWLGRLRRDLEAESVAASTIMEGVRVTVEEVRRLLAGDTPSRVDELDASLVLGYRDAMSYVLRRADDVSFAWHSELIRAIHDRVLGGAFELGAGRFRRIPVYISNGKSDEPVYTPPPSDRVQGLVDGLTEYLQADTKNVPAPVVAAVAHVGLAGIHPFKDGNGRTSRIVAAFAMYRGGYRAPEFTSLEEWWGSHLSDYYKAFDCLGKRWKDSSDVTPFVAAHVGAQRTQADALSLRLATQREIWTAIEDRVEGLGIEVRAANALWDVFFGRSVTNRYYRGLADVSKVTAAADLARLASAGLLRSRGAGRDTDYVAAEPLYPAVAEAAGLYEVARLGNTPEQMRDIIVVTLAQRLAKQDEITAREYAAGWGSAAR